MSEFTEELWTHYKDETTVCVDAIEASLADTPADSVTGARDCLRCLGLIKELSEAMKIGGTATLAGESALLLAAFHNSGEPLDEKTAGLLLEAVTHIKNTLPDVVGQKADIAPPEPLLAAIKEAGGRFENIAHEEKQEPGLESATDVSDHAVADPGLLIFFGSIISENIPHVAHALDAGYLGSTEDRSRVSTALEALRQAADGIGFANASHSMEELEKLLPEQGSLDESARNNYITNIGFVKSMIDRIEADMDIDVGSAVFIKSLQPVLLNDFEKLFEKAIPAIKRHRDSDFSDINEQESAESVVELLKLIDVQVQLIAPNPSLHNLVLTQIDIFGRIAHGEFGSDERLAPLAVKAIKLSERCAGDLLLYGESDFDDEVSELTENLKQVILNLNVGVREKSYDQMIEYLSGLGVEKKFLELLTTENCKDLMVSLSRGEHIYAILADLESDETVTELFVNWLNEDTNPITSRSVFFEERTYFEFILTSSITPDVISEKIKSIDPGGKMIVFDGERISK